jgi:hypothetical protein
MITKTKYISYKTYVIERHLGLVQSGSVFDPINLTPPIRFSECDWEGTNPRGQFENKPLKSILEFPLG